MHNLPCKTDPNDLFCALMSYLKAFSLDFMHKKMSLQYNKDSASKAEDGLVNEICSDRIKFSECFSWFLTAKELGKILI